VKYLKAFGQFWYDFIIGDDWKIAVAVVTTLAVLVAAMLSGALNDTATTLIGGALVLVAFSISLAIDVRKKPR
jgi:Na+-translocating ferredoxin:NAD+ oxidoreductase RnfD subunit